jgi:hypothetical protein
MRAAVFATAWLAVAVASAQQLEPLLSNNSWVEQVSSAPASVTRGEPHNVAIDFRVKKGYHINSNKPRSDFLIPTTLKLDPPADIVIGKVAYPAGEDRSFPFDPSSKLNVYTGEFALRALVRPLATVRPGAYRVRGELRYQACDDRACYPPKSMPVSFEVEVKNGPGHLNRRNPRQSPHVHQ